MTELNNLALKLKYVKNKFPNESKKFYSFVQRVSSIIKAPVITPSELVMSLSLIAYKSGVEDVEDIETILIDDLTDDKRYSQLKDRDELVHFAKIIDKIADDKEFAKEFRKLFEEKIIIPIANNHILVRPKVEEFSKYIVAAVEFWTDELKRGPSQLITDSTVKKVEYTDEQLSEYKYRLGKIIFDCVVNKGDVCHLDVDYCPNNLLYKAGKKLNNSMFAYLQAISTTITKDIMIIEKNGGTRIISFNDNFTLRTPEEIEHYLDAYGQSIPEDSHAKLRL